MTAFCWSISFSHNIMVCYCPLSVLSAPESILNEGQLHLAAIFQLSSRCHGDLVVSWWTRQESKGESGGGGAKCCKESGCRHGEREEGQGPGPGECDRRKNSTELCCHALLTPDKSAISKTRSIFQRPDAAFSSALHRNSNSTGAQDVLVLK